MKFPESLEARAADLRVWKDQTNKQTDKRTTNTMCDWAKELNEEMLQC
jgi:hypothetical protein